MAKATPGLKAALKVVNRLGKQMYAESDADYAVALSASNAGQANLAKQTRGLTRDLLLSSTQNRLAVQSLSQRARAGVKQTQAKQAGISNRYGAAMGASAAAQFAPAMATAKAGAEVLKGMSKASAKTAKVGQTVAGIAAAGVRAQKQAAAYSLNQALQQRNIIDNQTLAGLTGQLYQTAMEYNMQWELWKKQQDYAAKQAEKTSGFGTKQDAIRLMNEGGDIAAGAADYFRDAKNEAGEDFNPSDVSVSEAAQEYALENNYDPNGAEVALFSATMRELKSGYSTNITASEAYGNAMSTLFGGAKGFEKWGEDVIQGGQTKILMDSTREAYLAWLANNEHWWEEDGGDGMPPELGIPTQGVQFMGKYGTIVPGL